MVSKKEHIHLEELEQLANGSRDFIIRMLETSIAQTPPLLEKLKTANGTKDLSVIAEAVHRMRPAFHYLGRPDISTLLEEIENLCEGNYSGEINHRTEIVLNESIAIFEDVKQTIAELKG